MVDVAQLVRALDCGSRGRGFKPHPPPPQKPDMLEYTLLGFVVFFLKREVHYKST